VVSFGSIDDDTGIRLGFWEAIALARMMGQFTGNLIAQVDPTDANDEAHRNRPSGDAAGHTWPTVERPR